MEIWRDTDGKPIGWRADSRYDKRFVYKPWDAFDAQLTPEAKLWIKQSESARCELFGLHAFITLHSANDRFHFKLKWL